VTRFRYYISLLICALCLVGCAKQGMPTGGPKDVTPPVVMATDPANETLGFQGEQFTVEFDEYVVLKDVENNVLISPPMNPKPEIKTKGRGIVVKIKDTLRENATYNFQFKDAIADFNEGNLLPSFEYVFATGDNIDSMTVRGNVMDALTLKPVEEKEVVTVLLCDDTMGVRYQTRSDKSGAFQFNYIQPGQYRLVAMKDENKNLKVDSSETVAFADTLVWAVAQPRHHDDTVARDSSSMKTKRSDKGALLLLSTPDRRRQRIVASDFVAKDRIRIVAQCEMKQLELRCDHLVYLMPRLTPYQEGKQDTLTLWLPAKVDSLMLVLKDASGMNDTLRMHYRINGRPVPQPKGYGFKPLQQKSLHYYDTLMFVSAKPFPQPSRMDSLLYYLSSDSTSVGYADACSWLKAEAAFRLDGTRHEDAQQLLASIGFDWKPMQGKSYEVKQCLTAATDTTHWKVNVTSKDQYGNIYIRLDHAKADRQYLVELLDEKHAVVQRRRYQEGEKVAFEHLKAATYRVRLVEDADANGRWTEGDFFQGRQPEKVYYYEKTLSLRENWDMEETWTLSASQEMNR